MTIWTIGYFSLKPLHISARVSTAANSPHPTVTVPSTSSQSPLNSSNILSSRSVISRARRLSKIPSSVRVMLCPPRLNNVVPSSSSNAASCLERVGCVICNCSAALVKLCSLATVRKYLKTLNSIRFSLSFEQQHLRYNEQVLSAVLPS